MAPSRFINILPFLITIVTCSKTSPSTRTVTLQTRLGNITGVVTQNYMSNGTLYKFFNIPYAKAPIGKLRFAKPQPYGNWRSTRDATKLGPACLQSYFPLFYDQYKGFSEDCLQLNVYIPNNLSQVNNKSVMVWIHGGGYQYGSGTVYDGSRLSVLGDVIVVTINYRLGFLGFMSLPNHGAKGNYGLWDQILAFKWIKNNIGDYGGNPNDVTIFGESAGGFSVALHALIPSNRGLFHRAILQSGTALSFNAYQRSSNASVSISEMAGCHVSSTHHHGQILNCLRSVDGQALINKSIQYAVGKGFDAVISSILIPVQDNELFHRDPATLLKDHTSSEYDFFQSLDIMVGNCDMEGSLTLNAEPLLKGQYNINMEDGLSTTLLCYILAPLIAKDHYSGSTAVSNAICKKYTDQTDVAEQSMNILHAYADLFFVSGSVETLRVHTKNNKGRSTYQFIFSEMKLTSFLHQRTPSWYTGSAHGMDAVYLFQIDLIRSRNGSLHVSSDDVKFANQFSSYLANFAKTGDPNGPGLPLWLPYDESSKYPFMQLNSHNMTTGFSYRESWENFWIQDIPKIAQIKNSIVGK